MALPAVLSRKVPEVTLLFWIIKITSTAMGEATSDALIKGIGPAVAIPAAGLLLVLALAMQFRASQYRPWTYWSAVIMVAVFGTMVADAFHVGLGIPYALSSAAFAVALALALLVWYRSEGTLSIHSITTRRREAFYWTVVMATFALGTALGDLTAATLGLGFLASGFLFLGLFALPLVIQRVVPAAEVAMFWSAYIMTRPLGASFADWFGASHARSGLGYGARNVAIVTSIALVGLIGLASSSARTDSTS